MELREWLGEHSSSEARRLPEVILAFADAARRLAGVLSQDIADAADSVGTNSSGDGQKNLDVVANDIFLAALEEAPVRACISEENDGIVPLSPEGVFDVVMDPLDGSGNIGLNVPVGTIFGVFPSGALTNEGLPAGNELLAAGFVVYGAKTELVLSIGQKPVIFILAGGTFSLSSTEVRDIPEFAKMIAANTSNLSRWPQSMSRYLTERFESGSNMRWTGSLVVEARRILTDGGLMLYPGDNRPGYERGRLRLVYEAGPIAWLVEKAGGTATDGESAILTLVPGAPHDRVPLIFGSPGDIDRITRGILAEKAVEEA